MLSTNIEYQATDALSLTCTMKEDSTQLDDWLPLLTVDAQNENRSHIFVISRNSDNIIPLHVQPDALSNTSFTEEEFVVEQSLYNYCKAASLWVGQPNTEFHLDDRVLLVRKSIVVLAI